jgi:hypothetical protein
MALPAEWLWPNLKINQHQLLNPKPLDEYVVAGDFFLNHGCHEPFFTSTVSFKKIEQAE